MRSIPMFFRILVVIMIFLSFDPRVTTQASSDGEYRFTDNKMQDLPQLNSREILRTQKSIDGRTYSDTYWYNGEKLYSIDSDISACPQSGGVILYWNANYNCDNNKGDPGYRQITSTGLYNVHDGEFNDNGSSLKIPSGWSAKLYEHINGGGGYICYNSDVIDFYNQGYFPGTNVTINDNVSSVAVYNNTSCNDSWNVEYFSDTSLTTPCSPPNLISPGPFAFRDWGLDSPYSGCPNDNWSARFWRTIHFPAGNYTFGLGSDDWSRIFVNGEMVVNNWQGVGQHYVSRTYPEGDMQVIVEFADLSGQAKLAAWWWGSGYTMDRENRDPNQWYAQYWANKDLWWDSIIRVNEGTYPLNHVWGSFSHGYGLPVDRFSSRFERQIYFSCGNYRFTISTDDGVRFWIDNIIRLDSWVDQTTTYTVDVSLTDGYHEFKIEHYENGDGATISLDWSSLEPCPPQSPTNLSASAISGTRIKLTWDDNATNEDSYEIERSPNGGTSWIVIANLNPNTINYVDFNLNLGTTYYYRLRAHNQTAYSDYSNIANATTYTTSITSYLTLISR